MATDTRTGHRKLAKGEKRPGGGLTPSLTRWVRVDLGPQPGWARRISTMRSTTAAIWWGQDVGSELLSTMPAIPELPHQAI